MTFRTEEPKPTEEISGLTFEYNNGGRVYESGDPSNLQDCSVRAIALANDIPYSKVRKMLGRGFKPGVFTTWEAKGELLESLGWELKVYKTPKSIDAIKFDKTKNYILAMNRQAPHSVAIIQGVVKDTSDARVNPRRKYEEHSERFEYIGDSRPFAIRYYPSKVFHVWTKSRGE